MYPDKPIPAPIVKESHMNQQEFTKLDSLSKNMAAIATTMKTLTDAYTKSISNTSKNTMAYNLVKAVETIGESIETSSTEMKALTKTLREEMQLIREEIQGFRKDIITEISRKSK